MTDTPHNWTAAELARRVGFGPTGKATVIGLGRSGRAAAALLARIGLTVTAADSKPAAAFGDELDELKQLGVSLVFGEHPAALFQQTELVLVSPGVPTDHPQLLLARQRGVPVIGELELACRLSDAPLIAVTGTNGKSTTTTLIEALARAAGVPAATGGNLGLPLTTAILTAPDARLVIAEVSSFQLETIQRFRPAVGVVLNVAPDHLDRHGSFDAYAAAKAALFRNQGPRDVGILNADDPGAMSLLDRIPGECLFFSGTQPVRGAYLAGDQLVLATNGEEVPVCNAADLALEGAHNRENALAAIVAGAAAGLQPEAMRAGIRSYRGLPHRMELVGVVEGKRFINDSKGTNVHAVLHSLVGLSGPFVLIAGGRDKGGDFAPLRAPLSQAQAVVLIGEAAEKLERALGGTCPLVRAASMVEAVRKASDLCPPGGLVLLSPACASFDMYRNFEERGDDFRRAVSSLKGERR